MNFHRNARPPQRKYPPSWAKHTIIPSGYEEANKRYLIPLFFFSLFHRKYGIRVLLYGVHSVPKILCPAGPLRFLDTWPNFDLLPKKVPLALLEKITLRYVRGVALTYGLYVHL